MITAIIFIIVLGVLVLVHEFGHFIVAKRAGMKVEEFGFGFPPKIFGVKRGETTYSLNLIPFGGFVKILGEDGEDRNDPRSFSSNKIGKRAQVIVAGVVMNVLLAFVLLSIGNAIGLRVGLPDNSVIGANDPKVQIIEVASDSPADKAGLKVLDEIVGFEKDGKRISVKGVDETQKFIASNLGQEIKIILNRGGVEAYVPAVPRVEPPPREGALGIGLVATGLVSYPWYEAVYRGAQGTGVLLTQTAFGYFKVIRSLFVTGSPGVDLSGPVGIATITGQAARIGFTYLMQFTAIISINLAVLNIIPFPALDGGRLLFLVIEKIKRSPVSKKIEAGVNTAGFALLILLMIYVTTRDIARFF